jgi:hypothetical protein
LRQEKPQRADLPHLSGLGAAGILDSLWGLKVVTFVSCGKQGSATKSWWSANMTIFTDKEKIEPLAAQSLHYDRYSNCQYFLDRVRVDGKCGLVCGEELEEHPTHLKILLQPIYNEINVRKISSPKAIYDKYAVFADGSKVGQFTLVRNAWVPN